MKNKTTLGVLLTLLAASILVISTMALQAGATEKPMVNDVHSPVDAEKLMITGTSEAGAKITISGGTFELSPTYADDDGYWEKVVTLTQEATNNFTITASGADGTASESVLVTVVESSEQAAAYEATYGVDRTAPGTPDIDDVASPVDTDTIDITGTAEAGSTIVVSGDDNTSAAVGTDGIFSVEVTLQQNDTNKFYLSAMDNSSNMSSSVTVEIEEISGGDNDTPEDEDTATEITFPDVETGSWYEDYVMRLAEAGVVSGYDGTDLFGPGDYITRSAITKIAMETFGYEVLDSSTIELEDGVLTDVEEGTWYEDYVKSAYHYGIINGYPDGTFNPGGYVNRAEAAKILMAASGVSEMINAQVFVGDADNWENPFGDMTTEDWYYEYVMTLYTGDVIAGYDNGDFGGGDSITRAAVCRIAVELLDLLDEIRSTPTI